MKHTIPSITLRPITACLLAGFVWAGANLAAQPQTDADQAFGAISRLLEQADTALDRNDTANAARLFGATLRAWRGFAERFPAYAPDLVHFRMAYCQNQLDKLEQLARRDTQRKARQATNQPSAMPPRVQKVPVSALPAIRSGTPDQIRQIAADVPSSSAATYIKAAAFVSENNLPAARILMEDLLKHHPEEAAAHYNLVQLLVREEQPDMDLARTHYQQARRFGAPRDEDLEIVLNLPMPQTDATTDKTPDAQP